MGNYDKSVAEKNFQERFVRELEKYRWQAPDELDGNKRRLTVDDLIDHWRSELNRINADQLEGVPLTDGEFEQVMAKVKNIDNSFEAAKLLAMEGSTGKIDGILRDKNPRVSREQITLTIFKKAEVSGGDSSYKIAREVETANKNRFDLVLLINGLPLINIEQKRADKSLDQAFGQFKRYYRDGEYVNNFMAFSQMMVITSEVATRYFATPKSLADFNPSFVFGWADRKNNPINKWQDIVKSFLMIPMAHQMVGDYLIIDHARNEEDRRHMIMRPYQVYALQAIEMASIGLDNEEGLPHGGFVWHTTGSGKTITSFKTALFLSTRGAFDKVIFLVDRTDLDKKTSQDFKAYAAYESVSVDDTKHTYTLKKNLFSDKRGIIVTTTHKLSSLVKTLLEHGDMRLAEKNIVFIIDEAHRTTMGDMMVNIRSYFKKNGLFYGFTGTPLFDENKATGMINEKSQHINTTEKLFGPELHRYTIDQAIADGNVLGFHVDYINTGEFSSYESLREDIIEEIKKEKPKKSEREIERMVYGWEDLEVEKQARRRELLVYHDETHIPRVVEEILSNWEDQSQGRFFNAILTVAYKERVIDYYREFKRQLKDVDNPINIAMSFSFGNENEPDSLSDDILEEMFKDYGDFTGIEFNYGASREGELAYFEDIVDRGTRGGSARNKTNIDLIIVADQLLTGYDSKYLNTLYVDRNLQLQGLIQAYSRTNRIYGKEKEFGSIVNFQYPKITEERVNLALKLYGSGGKSSPAIVDPYPVAVEKFRLELEDMLQALENPSDWESLKTDKVLKEDFLSSFRIANLQLNRVMQYYEYSWDRETFMIDEHEWLRYTGAYKNLRPDDREDDEDMGPLPLVGRTKLSGSQVIDADYILSLIGAKLKSEEGRQTVDRETLRIIYEEIQELSDMGEDHQARLLREFVEEELVPRHIPSNIDFDQAFSNWKEDKIRKEVDSFAQEWGIDKDILFESYQEFSLANTDFIPYADDLSRAISFEQAENKEAGNQLRHNLELISKKIPRWFLTMKNKYK